MAKDKLQELLSAVKGLYEEYKAIGEEILEHKFSIPSEMADQEPRKDSFPEKERYDRLSTMEGNMREQQESLDSLIWELRSRILVVIKDEKERLVKSHFPIPPIYKCIRQYAEPGTHALCIEKDEVIKICGVDFSEHNDNELYVTAQKVGVDYHHKYGIPYNDLLKSFERIVE